MYNTKSIHQKAFPILETEIFERGIKKKTIAAKLGITEKTLSNKMNGISPFTWDEVLLIHSTFFPDILPVELFKRNFSWI